MSKPVQRIGDLRERVTLQYYTETRDEYGGISQAWADVDQIRARVEPIKAGEQVIAGGIQAVTDVLVHIRYREDVAPDWRLIWKGQTFNIKGVRNLDERNRFLALDCTSQ